MCTYCGTDNYRKIYENHHGPLLREPNGRAYEVHHIDGNHSNNDPSNLILVTQQEHYNIHYSQGDYGACLLMSKAMKISLEEKSKLASADANERIKTGSHHFLDKKWAKQKELDKVTNGTHPFLGGKIQRKSNQERVNNKTHHLLGTDHNQTLLEDGTHPSQIGWCCTKCRTEGLGITNYYNHLDSKNCEKTHRRKILGIHLLKISWTCECGKTGKGTGNFERHKRSGNCLKNK